SRFLQGVQCQAFVPAGGLDRNGHVGDRPHPLDQLGHPGFIVPEGLVFSLRKKADLEFLLGNIDTGGRARYNNSRLVRHVLTPRLANASSWNFEVRVTSGCSGCWNKADWDQAP